MILTVCQLCSCVFCVVISVFSLLSLALKHTGLFTKFHWKWLLRSEKLLCGNGSYEVMAELNSVELSFVEVHVYVHDRLLLLLFRNAGYEIEEKKKRLDEIKATRCTMNNFVCNIELINTS